MMPRTASPVSGSTFTTSAPMSARIAAALGAAIQFVTSTTRTSDIGATMTVPFAALPAGYDVHSGTSRGERGRRHMSVTGEVLERRQRAALIGGGTIGASWAALFLAHGLDVRVSDPAPQ